jgi:hypothetical protein
MQSTGHTGRQSSQPVQCSDDHDMHPLGGADDRVDRTCLQAEGAADARLLVDHRERARRLAAALGIERQFGAAGDERDPGDAGGAARRAAVDRRALAGDRLGIAAAVGIAAAAALRLRQRVEHRLGERLRAHG